MFLIDMAIILYMKGETAESGQLSIVCVDRGT